MCKDAALRYVYPDAGVVTKSGESFFIMAEKTRIRSGVMSWCLRVLAALSEDPSSIPSTHMTAHLGVVLDLRQFPLSLPPLPPPPPPLLLFCNPSSKRSNTLIQADKIKQST